MTGTLLTTLEVAERLGVSSAAVAQAVRTGALQPTARTNDDFLFTSREVAAFAERVAEAAAAPLKPPAAGNRTEWSGEVDRLNAWLKELTEALPATGAPALTGAPAATAAPASTAAAASPPTPLAAELPQEVVAAPASAAPLPPPPEVARTILERIAAAQSLVPLAAPAAAAPSVEQEPVAAKPDVVPAPPPVQPATVAVSPEAEPLPPVIWPEPEKEKEPVAAAPAPAGSLVPLVEAAVTPTAGPVGPPVSPGVDLSRQALLVVQPVVRFRVLREVTDRLATVTGVADARLERLEGGVASYRISFSAERPTADAIGAPLADLNLQVLLVDSFL